MATQNAENAAKEKALQQALDQIQKQYGKGAIMRLGESGPVSNIDVISTGSVSLDFATGVGGYPRGRIIEIYGPESSGKTTLTLHAIAEAQRNGGQAAFIDAEHALDPVYAKNLGVNVDELLVSQPDTGEQALEICEMLTRSGAVDIIVIDSVAALVPKAEIQGDMGDSHVDFRQDSCRRLSVRSQVPSTDRARALSSSTSSGKRSVLCSVILRLLQADVR